jgi:hypothetical protein
VRLSATVLVLTAALSFSETATAQMENGVNQNDIEIFSDTLISDSSVIVSETIPGWPGFRVAAEDRRPQRQIVDFQKNKPWSTSVPESDWEYVVIHHSGTAAGSVEGIHREHRSRKDASGNSWLGIGYHFVIGNGNGMPDGLITGTFRWKEQLHGAHSGHAVFNARGIGVCLIGNFEQTAPTEKQMVSVKQLVRVLAGRYGISGDRVVGHSAVRATSCPGKRFPLKDLREIASQEVMVVTPPLF